MQTWNMTGSDVVVGGDADVAASGVVPDFLGCDPAGEDSNALEVRHWCAEMAILDFQTEVASAIRCIRCGAVHVCFCVQH